MIRLIKYEIRNALGNIIALVFGFVFPIAMTLLLHSVLKDQAGNISVQLYVTNLLLNPLALIFVGFAALFSQEIEKDVPMRMNLFGISTQQQFIAKFVAQIVLFLASAVLYTLIVWPVLQLEVPSLFAVTVMVITILVFTITIFMFSYSIALIARKFSATYGITMFIYFATMILSGMMGIQYSQLPNGLRVISDALPTTNMVRDIPKLWTQDSYNLAPLLQSMIFTICLAGILYIIALKKNSRTHR